MNEIDSGTQFDFTYAPGTSVEQIIGFEMAGAIWSSYLQDDVAVRIYVESTDELPENLVGAALPGKKKKVDYDKLWDKMSSDITSDDDLLAFNNLPSVEKEFSVLIDGVELNKTKEFRISNANAKALDLLDDDRKKLDGYIVINELTGSSTAGWDYDALRSGDLVAGKIDFLSVAMHEIGHVLGFVSGIDDNGWLKVLTESRDKGKEIKNDDFKFASPLDLFRYSDSSAARGELDLSTGGNPFFSIDGGNTNLGNFANGEHTDFGGDGYQASHWQQNSSQGIMNPLLPVGERKDISNLDLTAMDAIGWDVNPSVALDWENLYADAVANSETATIEDRSKDVEKMVKESKYKGRRSRSGRSSHYSWQMGLWQYTTWESLDAPEEITPKEAEAIVAEPSVLEVMSVSQAETVFDTDTVTELESENETVEDIADSSTTEENDALDITGVSLDNLNNDSLLAEASNSYAENNDVLTETILLPDLMVETDVD